MRKLFERQLEKATDETGQVDLELLERLVTAAYDEAEKDRTRTDRSIELMVGELMQFQVGLEAEIKKRTAQLRTSQKSLRTQNTRFLTALENMAQGLAMFDGRQRLVICNRQYLEMYKLPRRYGRAGTSLVTILKARIAAGTSAGEPEDYVAERVATAEDRVTSSITLQLNDGRFLAVAHRAMPDGGWVTMHRDITELHSMQAELTFQAYHDPLTALPNRNLFYQRLGQAFDGRAADKSFAVLCLDLDGFKAINDSMGHASGDKLLKLVAERLRNAVGGGDVVGRMGGDEFAVLCPDASSERALEVAAAILAEIRRPFDIDDHAVLVGVSIGIAMAPTDGDNADRLLNNGDLALYSIKRGRRGGHRFFSPDLAGAILDRNRLEGDIRRALANGGFELFYQPVLDITSRQIVGFESLLRWNHPTEGVILPAEFVPLAEELGLIVPIGEWVIREALAEAAHWPPHLRIAVNVSPVQFDRGNLMSVLMNALAATAVAPDRVELEITESLFLENNKANLDLLHRLRSLGLRIALDDFGSGYSALSYLLAFPFDKLKIDGAFVRARDEGGKAGIILEAVADIGRRMGIRTTAEGIETPEQFNEVRRMGYDEGQGYLIAAPMSRDAVRRLLEVKDAQPTPVPQVTSAVRSG